MIFLFAALQGVCIGLAAAFAPNGWDMCVFFTLVFFVVAHEFKNLRSEA